MTIKTVRSFLLVPLLLQFGGCGHDGPAASTDAGATSSAMTYWGDVAPVLDAKCVRCHQAGGIAPFALDGYSNAKGHGALASAAVTSGEMPPYYIDHDGSCGDFQADEALTPAEKQKITAWFSQGMAEGVPAASTLPPLPTLTDGKDFHTPPFAPVAAGGPLAQHDDYRCFLIDPALGADTFITGYEVSPGNPAMVHHVIAFVVDPAKPSSRGRSNAELIQELDAQSPDVLGWECFGGAGDGVEVEGAPVDWAPGQGVVEYPPKMGVPLPQTQRLVVQIHYNLADPRVQGMMDSTTVRLRFASQVDRRLVFALPDAFLGSLRNPTPDSLAPGQASVKYSWKMQAADMGLAAPLPYADLIAVMPHMHQRGRGLDLSIGATSDSPLACAARTERWDSHWQKMYFYRSPPRLTPASELQVTCDFDTSRDTAPVLPGWGTQNEMCLTVLMLALPPGL
jgi:hypothetical protein